MKNLGFLTFVGLGSDGMTYDMLQEYKVNYLIHKHVQGNPQAMGRLILYSRNLTCGGMEGFQMLMHNNSKMASKYFPKPVGRLEAGAYADLILVDYNSPTPM